MNALTVSDLEAGYGNLQVLWGVSLEVGKGEVTVVLGPNGAGKSTLLGAIAGDVRMSSGTVSVDGTVLDSLPVPRRLTTGLAWVPEGRNVFHHLTVRENLKMSARLAGRRAEYAETEQMVFDLFPVMAEKIGAAAGTLSGGQQQILSISRALIRSPKIALLDEPTVGLAPVIVERLGQAIAATKERGISWLIAEQNLGWLTSIVDSTYVMQGGHIVTVGGPEVIVNRESIQRAFFDHATVPSDNSSGALGT